MPSFDIVSEVDMHELNNALDQANREVVKLLTRYYLPKQHQVSVQFFPKYDSAPLIGLFTVHKSQVKI